MRFPPAGWRGRDGQSLRRVASRERRYVAALRTRRSRAVPSAYPRCRRLGQHRTQRPRYESIVSSLPRHTHTVCSQCRSRRLMEAIPPKRSIPRHNTWSSGETPREPSYTESDSRCGKDRSIPYRGAVMPSLRQCGHRLGLVSRLRSRKTKSQSWQREGSSTNRLVLSRAIDLTTWTRWSSTCRSGIASICASWCVARRVPINSSMMRWRGVRSGGNIRVW